jgi:hypothetical protein
MCSRYPVSGNPATETAKIRRIDRKSLEWLAIERRTLHYWEMFMMGRRKAVEEDGVDDDATKWSGPGPKSEDARRVQRGVVDDIRSEATKRGVKWKALLDRAELSSASRSRATHGTAGVTTLGKLQRALDELAPVASSAGDAEDAATIVTRIDEGASLGVRRRWVVVQRQDRQMFVGITGDPDEQIADNGRVRLDRCRPVRSTEISPESLASVGQGDRRVVGDEAPSALILNVAVVYDVTKAAVRTFDRK